MNRLVNRKASARQYNSSNPPRGSIARIWNRLTQPSFPVDSIDYQRQAARLAILHDVSHAILEAHSVRAVVQAVLLHIRELVPQCPEATAALFDSEMRELTVYTADSSSENRVSAEWQSAFLPEELRDMQQQLRQGTTYKLDKPQPLLFPAGHSDCTTSDQVCHFLFPLVAQGELIGTLNLSAPGDDAFGEDDQATAREIANLLSLAFQNARLLDQVRAGRERMQKLSRQLLVAQETERRHIARELHDEIGQGLTAVKINLQGARRSNPSLPTQIEDSVAIVERTLNQVRQMSLDLHPSLLDDLGLVAALKWYVDRHAQRTGITAQLVAEPLEPRPPAEIETACFRVVQEALTNVSKHAQANSVLVGLRQYSSGNGNPCLELTVNDDGVGFDVKEKIEQAARGSSLGLLGMQERVALLGGQLDIKSKPGEGTVIRTTFPGSMNPQHRIERRKRTRDR